MSILYEAVEAIIESMEEDNEPLLKPYVKMLRIALKAAGKQEAAPTFNGMEASMAAHMLAPESMNRSMIEKYKKKEAVPDEQIKKLEEWMGGMAECKDGPYAGEYVGIAAGMPYDAFTKVGEREVVYRLKQDGLYEWKKQPEKQVIVPG